MGKPYLIDSNVVIDYLTGSLPEPGKIFMDNVIDSVPRVSIITKLEVLGFNTSEEDYRVLVGFFNDAFVIALMDEVANQTIELRKHYSIKLPDAIIAASAQVHDLVLITRNRRDFEKITTLECLDPHNL